MDDRPSYDVVIVGAGVSGAAQYFAAAKYTNIKRVLLIDKAKLAGSINSHPTQNSQTLHEGDIETNYSLEKATAVKHKAAFTRRYLEHDKTNLHGSLFLRGPKMVLGVGSYEVDFLNDRHREFAELFPGLRKLNREELAKQEPKIMKGRADDEKVSALYNENGLTVNFGKLAEELISDGQLVFNEQPERSGNVWLGSKVTDIVKTEEGYELQINGQTVATKYLSICAGAHSMYFAKRLGIEAVATQSLLLVAGNFYYTPKYLKSKVYTVQNPKLPFSAVHGDPDILNPDTKTRFGPTTRIVATLERRRFNTLFEYVSTVNPFLASTLAYARIMLDKDFFFYALKHNLLFIVPKLGNYLFVKEARKIIPTLSFGELYKAKGQGGVRPQIVQTSEKNPLNLGEAKIIDERIRFNVTPSPGASTCVYNGLIDMKEIAKELKFDFMDRQVKTDFDLLLSNS